ncbi:MAG TPA: mercury methylation corrinoid protein HgcA [Thermoleophilia bacterium]|nr:mercury methylation corrinoid protein HgcA [Thermoleophilia bacterium]
MPRLSRQLTRADRLGAWQMRWGFGRDDYRVRPGLYALGDPGAKSPVLVTANYKLTVDGLRSVLSGVDAWVLVVDTRGINVWCAAGKGTISAEEVARVVDDSRLAEVVEHRRLVLPQLAGPGVAAHRVKELCGFRVTWGPVRASDIPRFLESGMKADAEMRAVTFDFDERLVLAPAELNYLWDRRLLLAYAGVIAASSIDRDGVSLTRGLRRGLPVIGAAGLAVLAGGGITPVLLPWLPGRAFSLKGATAGAGVALAADAVLRGRLTPAARVTLLAGVPALASYAAMNFTGSSTITSPSGVQKEMRTALPLQMAGAAVAVGGWLVSRLGR